MAIGKGVSRSKKHEGGAPDDADLMSVPEYMEKSSVIIAEALQKGFDVLHLENGGIVTTGTKTVVTTYRWNGKTGKMVKLATQESAGSHPMPIMNISAALKKSKKPVARKKISRG
jgi:hypothetical protein